MPDVLIRAVPDDVVTNLKELAKLLAIAGIYRTKMITADRKLAEAVAGTEWSEYVLHLSQFDVPSPSPHST